MKRVFVFVLLCTLCLGLYVAGQNSQTAIQTAINEGELLRLHVVASSDDAYDQETKLLVRDAVLSFCGPKLEAAGSFEGMQRVVQSVLPQIEKIAKKAALQRGFHGEVVATFGIYDFPEKTYAGDLVPAGQYKALRVVLGDGGGANWWCVMYPPLCFVGEKAVAPSEKVEVQFTSSLSKWWKKIAKKPSVEDQNKK